MEEREAPTVKLEVGGESLLVEMEALMWRSKYMHPLVAL